MEKIIKLFNGDGTPFPKGGIQVEIFSFEYSAERMGGSPSISASFMYPICLDSMWNDGVYAVFNKEKYFVKNIPSSSKDNTSERYNHEIELLSERDELNHIYFIDAVQGNGTIDVPKTNTTQVMFMGDLKEFVARLNSSLKQSKSDYIGVIDSGITTKVELVSFDKRYVLQALQDAFGIFNIPYYFKGKVIHFGYEENQITQVFKYGSNDALLSISKENANYMIINRITGVGSEENIQPYYPNPTARGTLGLSFPTTNKGITDGDVRIYDQDKFARQVKSNGIIEYNSFSPRMESSIYKTYYDGAYRPYNQNTTSFNIELLPHKSNIFYFKHTHSIDRDGDLRIFLSVKKDNVSVKANEYISSVRAYNDNGVNYEVQLSDDYSYAVISGCKKGKIFVYTNLRFYYQGSGYKIKFAQNPSTSVYWSYEGQRKEIEDLGLQYATTKMPLDGDKIVQETVKYITPSQKLMPSIYRESNGDQRFYNAISGIYDDQEGGKYVFENEYSDNRILEGLTEFPEIRPTIIGINNADNEPINTFLEIAYDIGDNDEYNEKDNLYEHPYFYAKLRKINGEFGFNLFDHANEKQEMVISMKSGVCGACNFIIGVDKETQKNIVQVDAQGNLKYDNKTGKVLLGKAQPQQNDTINNEVWIALKKDINTYPTFAPMPNAKYNLKPSVNDPFVILGITLPNAYIIAAEKRLDDALIRHMYNSNKDKFNFSIDFSRIYLEKHKEILEKLNENSKILVSYNGVTNSFFINSFSYRMDENVPLPLIKVNLTDTITLGKDSLQTRLDSVKEDILTYFGNSDFLKAGLKYFIRKDIDDFANGLIKFLGGIEVGSENEKTTIGTDGKIRTESVISQDFLGGMFGKGFAMSVDKETNRSRLEVDELLVRVKQVVNELEIGKINYSGGNWIFSPSGMECQKVEDTVEGYKCYIRIIGDDISIENNFRINDLITCREFNVANKKNRYYWRKCVGIGSDYIILSKNDHDTSIVNDAPMQGDSMIVLGNTTDKSRQNAIIIGTIGTEAPYIRQYSGINGYSLDEHMVTSISPKGNVFKGDFTLSTGDDIVSKISSPNYAISTKPTFVSGQISYLQKQALLGFCKKIDISDFEEGDDIVISFFLDYSFDKKDSTSRIQVAAKGNKTGWNTGNLHELFTDQIKNNFDKKNIVIHTTITKDMKSNDYLDDVRIRLDNIAGNISVKNFKVEKGLTMTPWCPSYADTEQGLLDTGIDIKNKIIKATTDTFIIQNNNGKTTAKVNKDGVLETNGGVFNNVNVEGLISAREMELGVSNAGETGTEHIVNGAFIKRSGNYTLPSLETGKTKMIYYSVPLMTRTPTYVTFSVQGSGDYIMPNGDFFKRKNSITLDGVGFYIIIGVGAAKGNTEWTIQSFVPGNIE